MPRGDIVRIGFFRLSLAACGESTRVGREQKQGDRLGGSGAFIQLRDDGGWHQVDLRRCSLTSGYILKVELAEFVDGVETKREGPRQPQGQWLQQLKEGAVIS